MEKSVWEGTAKLIATLFWDLSNYHEYPNRNLLVSRAAELDFPMSLMRSYCNTYQSLRICTFHGYSVRSGFACRGIPAGDGFATFDVQIYSLQPMIRWQARHTCIGGSMFNDDLAAGTTGNTTRQVAKLTLLWRQQLIWQWLCPTNSSVLWP